jgi:hypothetical protein
VATFKLLITTGLCVLSSAWLPAPKTQQSLTVNAVRFYRPQLQQTQIKAFVEIPYAVLTPTTDGAGGRLTYQITVRIKDSTGLELVQNAWSGHATAAARQSGASGMEILDFALAPGLYRLEVAVVDSLSGRRLTSDLPLEAFRGQTDVSDLLLTPQIRTAQAQDTVPMPGEIRKGNLLIAGAAELILTPLRSKAHYLLETYNPEAETAQLTVVVQDSSKKVIVSTPASSAQLPAGGGVLTGTVDLVGDKAHHEGPRPRTLRAIYHGRPFRNYREGCEAKTGRPGDRQGLLREPHTRGAGPGSSPAFSYRQAR